MLSFYSIFAMSYKHADINRKKDKIRFFKILAKKHDGDLNSHLWVSRPFFVVFQSEPTIY